MGVAALLGAGALLLGSDVRAGVRHGPGQQPWRRPAADPARPHSRRLARGTAGYWTPTGRRGVSNGPTEAVNALIKKVKRVGHGFRNLHNYRLRLLLAVGLDWNTVPWHAPPATPIRGRSPRLVA